MTKVVSLEVIEKAFDEVVQSIDRVEKLIESHIDIEINEMKIAQQEKIHYLNKRVNHLEGNKKEKSFPLYQMAIGR